MQEMRQLDPGTFTLPPGDRVSCGNRTDVPRAQRRHVWLDAGTDDRHMFTGETALCRIRICSVCGRDDQERIRPMTMTVHHAGTVAVYREQERVTYFNGAGYVVRHDMFPRILRLPDGRRWLTVQGHVVTVGVRQGTRGPSGFAVRAYRQPDTMPRMAER